MSPAPPSSSLSLSDTLVDTDIAVALAANADPNDARLIASTESFASHSGGDTEFALRTPFNSIASLVLSTNPVTYRRSNTAPNVVCVAPRSRISVSYTHLTLPTILLV